MKKVISILLIFALILSSTAGVLAESKPNVNVNGVKVHWTDASPFIDKANRTQVPLRASMEACGLKVVWDNANREAIVTDGSTTVIVPIGKYYITVNGKQKKIDTSAQIKNSRTYLPIRAVAESFGYGVYWDSQYKMVSLIKLNYDRVFYLGVYDNDYIYTGINYKVIINKKGQIKISSPESDTVYLDPVGMDIKDDIVYICYLEGKTWFDVSVRNVISENDKKDVIVDNQIKKAYISGVISESKIRGGSSSINTGYLLEF